MNISIKISLLNNIVYKGYESLPNFINDLIVNSDYTFYEQSFKIIKSLVEKYYYETEQNLKCIIKCLDLILQITKKDSKYIELIDNEITEILDFIPFPYTNNFYDLFNDNISPKSFELIKSYDKLRVMKLNKTLESTNNFINN